MLIRSADAGQVIDDDGPHEAALSLFFKTFEERNLLHGAPIGSAGESEQKQFTAFGRLLLHSLHVDQPTGKFIAPRTTSPRWANSTLSTRPTGAAS